MVKINQLPDIANDATVAYRSDAIPYGVATATENPRISSQSSVALPADNLLNYLYCEYFKGFLLLALSLCFVFAVPTIVSRSGGLALMVNRTIKRTTDILGSVLGMILTLPFWIIVPIIIKIVIQEDLYSIPRQELG